MFRSTIAAAMLALASLAPASASETTVGDLQIVQPWARATAPSAPTGAAFVTLTNTGESDDTLVGADSNVAETIELHQTAMENGTMRMRRVDGGIPLPAGQAVSLEPGGFHIMLIGLAQPLSEGESFELTLSFAEAGSVTVQVPIFAPGTMPSGMPDAGGEHQGHMDGNMDGHTDDHTEGHTEGMHGSAN